MSATRAPRGSYAKTPDRRRVIVDAGLEVFASGYHSGSIREIAEKVGMSQAGLLHHFSSKSALLAAVLEQRDAEAITMVPVAPVDGIRTVRGLIRLAEYNASVPGLVELYCVLSAEATAVDHPAHEYFRNRYEYTIRVMAEALTMMADRGQLAPDADTDSMAKTVIALLDGLQVQWLLDRDSVDMADMLRRYLQPLVTVEI